MYQKDFTLLLGDILVWLCTYYNGGYFKLFIIHVSLPEKFSDLQTFLPL